MLSSPVKLGNYHLTGCTSDFKTAAVINKFPFCYCLLGQTKLCHHPLPSTTTHHHPPPAKIYPPRPTTITTNNHQPPPAKIYPPPPPTTIHHDPPPAKIYPLSPTTSQNISTTNYYHPPTAKTFFKRNPFIRISSHV